MSRIESTLTRLEARLRAMIEGDAGRDGIPRKFFNQLRDVLVEAMRGEAQRNLGESNQGGKAYALPDKYTLVLPTAQAELLLNHPAALDHLAGKLERSAAQYHLPFAAPPILRVVADPGAMQPQAFCTYTRPGKGDSLTVEMAGARGLATTMRPAEMPEAFLIVNGLSTFHLKDVVTNIGSDPGNQLVLAHPRVSCRHAQLRFTAGHFVIFDLDSGEGTIVNGVAVSNHLLNPGDVVLLAGVPLVYGEETANEVGHTQQLPAEPPPPEMVG